VLADKVRLASVEEITKVKGFGRALAQKVSEELRG
jgi:excinuclease UvrABC nuclease subunit